MTAEMNLGDFTKKSWTFVLVSQGKTIYKSKSRGLKPLIFSFKNYRQQMRRAVVFDKIVGRAAALILTEVKVKKILTPLICEDAVKILQTKKIEIEFGEKIENILNCAGDNLCPMEKLSAGKNFKELKGLLKF